MKQSLFRQNLNADKGFTLVELLVGLVLSLFIVAVSITYLVSSSATFKSQTNDSIIQENARFALELLTQHIRTSGVNPVDNGLATPLDTIYSQNLCQAGELAGLGNQPCTRDGVAAADNNSDRLAVDYVMDTPGTACNGQNVVAPFPVGGFRMASVFWTADLDGDGIRSLYCQPFQNGAPLGQAVPLVDGVERMQVQYGIDADDNGLVESYLSYTNLIAEPDTRVASGLRTPNQSVRIVRVALLISSGLGTAAPLVAGGLNANTEQVDNFSYTLLDAPAITFNNDQVLRQIYSTSVVVHNTL